MKKLFSLCFSMFMMVGVSVFATQPVSEVENADAGECNIYISFSDFPQGTDFFIEFDYASSLSPVDDYIAISNGNMNGKSVTHKVVQGSSAKIEIILAVQHDWDKIYPLYINNEFKADLHEINNNRYIYTVNTSGISASVNLSIR